MADAAVQVMLEQLQRERIERRLDGAHLRQYVDAVAIVVDHPPDAADLAFDAIEPLRQRRCLGTAVRDHGALSPAPQALAASHARRSYAATS